MTSSPEATVLDEAGMADAVTLCQATAQRLRFVNGASDVFVSSGSRRNWKRPVAGSSRIHYAHMTGGVGLRYDLVARLPDGVARRNRQEMGRFLQTMHRLRFY
jgi:hypothetical protein